MKILVTGSAGMIGSILAAALMDEGHEVLGVDRLPNQWCARLEAATARIDLTDADALAALAPSEVVVHLAANARVHELVLNPRGALENLTSTFEALEYARRHNAYFVFASSREVYGNQGQTPYREADVSPSVVESPYAASKFGGELLVRSYGAVYGLRRTTVRLSNVSAATTSVVASSRRRSAARSRGRRSRFSARRSGSTSPTSTTLSRGC